jgi:hypothetical protein
MSYERLATALIETQQSMLGQRAINVAQSIDGLAVDDDGSATEIDGGDDHDRAVIAALVDEYVSIMGQSAHNRLDDVADEFADDLLLPENLGGPAELPAASAGESGTAPATESAAVDDGPGTGEATATGTAADADAPPGAPPAADAEYEPADPDEVVTNIWGEEHASEDESPNADPSDVDIESVYITVTDDGGWEQPIPISRAIVRAVTNVTDLGEDDLADLSTYVETHRIVRLLETDATDPVSFEVEGHDVTLHADGGIHVE